MNSPNGTIDGREAHERLAAVIQDDTPFQERAERALEIGVEYFDVQNGHVTAIDETMNRWEAVASTDPPDGTFPAGLTLDLQTTYCRITVADDEPVALHDAPNQGWADDPAYRAHNLDCYHGTVVRVGDEVYGTVCFVDEVPREDAFSESETLFAEIIAGKLGRVLERRRYEQDIEDHGRALKAHREWLRGLVEVTADIVFRLTPNGNFSFISDRAESLLGYTARDLHGQHFTTVLQDGEPTDRGRDAFATAQDGQTVELLELPLSSADGRTVYGDIRAVPVYPEQDDANNDAVGVQGVVRDVTKRWRFQRLASVLNRVLRHNLRNEMNVVAGFGEQLERDYNEELAAIGSDIRHAAEELIALSETARSMEQRIRNEQEISDLDVVPYVEAAVEDVREVYDDVTISLDTPDEVMARGTPEIEAVAHELIDNAAKHAGDAPCVRVSVQRTDSAVTLIVADDGPGITDGDRTVLQSGEETKLRHGSGLGLLLVYWLVTGMEGGIDVTVDGGTSVTIRLQRPS